MDISYKSPQVEKRTGQGNIRVEEEQQMLGPDYLFTDELSPEVIKVDT